MSLGQDKAEILAAADRFQEAAGKLMSAGEDASDGSGMLSVAFEGSGIPETMELLGQAQGLEIQISDVAVSLMGLSTALRDLAMRL